MTAEERDRELAERIFVGKRAISIVEGRLVDALELHHGVAPDFELRFDDYDSSIEFDFEDVLEGWRPSAGLLAVIAACGFQRVWFNFADGSEIYMNGERRAVRAAGESTPRGDAS